MGSATTQYIPPAGRPASTQLNLRQMVGELLSWNPDLPPQQAVRFIQNAYRRILDRRLWYSLMVQGIISSPALYSVGTAQTTTGSPTVVGNGTAWTTAMVGRQFRTGFNFPAYTIIDVPDGTHLTIDVPWGDTSYQSVGYFIVQMFYSLGKNVKFCIACLNQLLGYRLRLHMDHPDVVNTWDTWRSMIGWTYMMTDAATMSPPVTPTYQEKMVELYPAPFIVQSFPFLAYVQPPDLLKDLDCPTAWVRSDVIVLGAIADALTYKGRNSRYFDPQTAVLKLKQQQAEFANMEAMDNNISQRDVLWDFSQYPMAQFGADWASAHAELPSFFSIDD